MNLKDVSQLLYQLKLANQEMTGTFEKTTGFSITRYELMQMLSELGKCSQSQLQSELKIDSAAVTRHLKILEEENYVTRVRNKDNHREIFVEITDQAVEELSRCEREHKSVKEELGIALNKAEEEQLLQLLSKLRK
ncbi:MAG: MarR family transcriptional regulator [Streptococcaceae bacterium]|jgi:DNA-binding MarR family transcriptional regulator|nr:MarR family transcriptional regulator [Streptococcaceae bacterium]